MSWFDKAIKYKSSNENSKRSYYCGLHHFYILYNSSVLIKIAEYNISNKNSGPPYYGGL